MKGDYAGDRLFGQKHGRLNARLMKSLFRYLRFGDEEQVQRNALWHCAALSFSMSFTLICAIAASSFRPSLIICDVHTTQASGVF